MHPRRGLWADGHVVVRSHRGDFKGHAQLPALMGTMESVCGLGFVGGPALGGWLHDSTSFSATMIMPSAVLAMYVVLPWRPSRDPGGKGKGGEVVVIITADRVVTAQGMGMGVGETAAAEEG